VKAAKNRLGCTLNDLLMTLLTASLDRYIRKHSPWLRDPDDPSDPTGDPSDPTGDHSDPTGDPSDPTGDPYDPTDALDSQRSSFSACLPHQKRIFVAVPINMRAPSTELVMENRFTP
jgi:hypothetical protein